MKRNDTAAKHGKNAAFRAAFAGSQRFIACLAFALLTLVCSSASLASAEQQTAHTSSAAMSVGVQVAAHCDVVTLPGTGDGDVLSTFDVTCPRTPHALIQKSPTIYTVEDGGKYVVTTVLL